MNHEPLSPKEKMGKDESRKMHDKIGFVHPHKVYKPFSDVQQN